MDHIDVHPKAAPKLSLSVFRDPILRKAVTASLVLSTTKWLFLLFLFSATPLLLFQISTENPSSFDLELPLKSCASMTYLNLPNIFSVTEVPLLFCLTPFPCSLENKFGNADKLRTRYHLSSRELSTRYWLTVLRWILLIGSWLVLYLVSCAALLNGRRALRLLPFGILVDADNAGTYLKLFKQILFGGISLVFSALISYRLLRIAPHQLLLALPLSSCSFTTVLGNQSMQVPNLFVSVGDLQAEYPTMLTCSSAEHDRLITHFDILNFLNASSSKPVILQSTDYLIVVFILTVLLYTAMFAWTTLRMIQPHSELSLFALSPCTLALEKLAFVLQIRITSQELEQYCIEAKYLYLLRCLQSQNADVDFSNSIERYLRRLRHFNSTNDWTYISRGLSFVGRMCTCHLCVVPCFWVGDLCVKLARVPYLIVEWMMRACQMHAHRFGALGLTIQFSELDLDDRLLLRLVQRIRENYL